MDHQEQANPKSKRLKIAIIILSVLLVLSAGGLAAQYVYLNFFAPAQATVTVPDNLIGEKSHEPEDVSGSRQTSVPADDPVVSRTDADGGVYGSASSTVSRPVQADKPTAPKVELYKGKLGDNQRFEVKNMLPGDTETKYFCLKAYHDNDIDLYFKAEITEQTKSLGNALHIKVTHLETGRVLYDAPFSEIDGKEFVELLKANSEKATTAYYQIDVSLDTTVGNEYQVARLTADFEWYVKDEGGLTPPPTGDNTNVLMWIILAGSSFLLMFLLLLGRRRKEEQQHG